MADRPSIFDPVTLKGAKRDVELRNRILLAPMCMYACTDRNGLPDDFHLMHFGQFANGGFGLVMTEACGVNPSGRISCNDVGLWETGDKEADYQMLEAHRRITDHVHSRGGKIGVQLAHAGAKAARTPDLPGIDKGWMAEDEGGWSTIGPNELEDTTLFNSPRAMKQDDIDQVIQDFGTAARLARQAGYDVVQIHGAHGYLIHQFLSPLTNKRTDCYGGSLKNRMRLAVDIAGAVREGFDGPVGLRVSGTDWVHGGVTPEENAALAAACDDVIGLSWVDVSTGGLTGSDPVPVGPGYQVPPAREIAAALADRDTIVTAVGLITNGEQAESVVADGLIDGVSIGRAALRDPMWPLTVGRAPGIAADRLPVPANYHRAF